MPRSVGDEHARQRPNFHRLFVIARRLEPGILVLGIEELIRRFRAGVVGRGLALRWVQSLRFIVIGEPGVLDVLGDLGRVERVHRAQIPVQNHPAREEQLAGVVRVGPVNQRQVAVGQEVAQPFAQPGPFQVEGRHGQHVGQVHLLDELFGLGKQRQQLGNLIGVDGRLAVRIDRDGHAAHQVGLQMRVLGPQNGMGLDHLALPIQGFQVVRHRHQVGFRAAACTPGDPNRRSRTGPTARFARTA